MIFCNNINHTIQKYGNHSENDKMLVQSVQRSVADTEMNFKTPDKSYRV